MTLLACHEGLVQQADAHTHNVPQKVILGSRQAPSIVLSHLIEAEASAPQKRRTT